MAVADEREYGAALGKLRAALVRFKPGQAVYEEIVAPRDEVFARFRPIFSREHVGAITRDEFTSFLYFENNRHWSGLYRQGLGAANDMETLRTSLSILLNEDAPIRERFSESIGMVSGLGKGIATAILTVAYPGNYGVWNNTSEAALRSLGLWPTFERGEGLGGRYEKINGVLLRLAGDLGVDLWLLDATWWFLDVEGVSPAHEGPPQIEAVGERFALERQLKHFLLENWNKTSLGKDWAIYSTPEDAEAGNEFPTDVGRIDLLAVHRKEKRFLVIELKRDQSTDATVGQALRYVGWVKRHLAKDGQAVEALIIAHQADKAAQYALSTLDNVSMVTYQIEFNLSRLEPLPQ